MYPLTYNWNATTEESIISLIKEPHFVQNASSIIYQTDDLIYIEYNTLTFTLIFKNTTYIYYTNWYNSSKEGLIKALNQIKTKKFS